MRTFISFANLSSGYPSDEAVCLPQRQHQLSIEENTMELYLDTASVAEVERLAPHLPAGRGNHHRALSPPVKSRSGMCCRACIKSRRSEGHPLRADHEPRRAGHGGRGQTLSNAVPGIVVKIGHRRRARRYQTAEERRHPDPWHRRLQRFARPAGRAGRRKVQLLR